jgi:ComF family protein
MSKICKVCFKNFTYFGIQFFNKNICICSTCFNELAPIFRSFYKDGIHYQILYDYNEKMRNLIFNFKGCFDFELKDIFLCRFVYELRLKYRGYYLVPLPSSKEDDEKRGFNHVIEIFKCLNLPFINCLYKKIHYKQSDLNKAEREKVYEKLDVINGEELTNKKILIVDDIMTTGSSIKAAIKYVKKYNPKVIKVLVLCHKNEK